ISEAKLSLPIVVHSHHQSATGLLPGCGYGRRWNPLNSVGRLLQAAIARCFSVSAIPALLLSGRRGTSPGVVNLGAAIGRHCLFPLKPLQKSPSGFAKCFRRLSSVVVHGTQHDRRVLKCPTKVLKELTR